MIERKKHEGKLLDYLKYRKKEMREIEIKREQFRGSQCVWRKQRDN